MSTTTKCPCGSGRTYEKCCLPYISGEQAAPTAEAMMRSRYSAYCNLEIAYLCETLHPKHREDHDEKMTRKWAEESEWLGLEILEVTGGGESDNLGTVEFVASYSEDGRTINHHELARFAREENKWYFVEGKLIVHPYVREAPKIGRNDPCACGSSRKYKKCCGKPGIIG